MLNRNIVSISWVDHQIFGEGDGKLDTPQALERRITAWKKDLRVKIIHLKNRHKKE